MHATVLQQDLNKGLGIVGRVVATRGQLPVLANILIEATKEGLVLAATNLEIGLRVRVGGKIIELGAITIPGRSLGELVGSLAGESLDLQTDGEKLKIKTGKSAGILTGIAASEFPPFARSTSLRATEGKAPIKIKKELLLEIASQVAYAAAVDGNYFKAFAKLHPTKNFPYISLIFLCALGFVFSLLFKLSQVISSILAMRIIVQFIALAVGVVLLRKKFGTKDLAYKMWLFPLPVILSIAIWIFLFISTGWFALWGSLIAVAVVIAYLVKNRVTAEAQRH